jgi:hypothetical protein
MHQHAQRRPTQRRLAASDQWPNCGDYRQTWAFDGTQKMEKQLRVSKAWPRRMSAVRQFTFKRFGAESFKLERLSRAGERLRA